MTEQRTDQQTIDQAVDQVMATLEDSVIQSVQQYEAGMRAVGGAAALAQKIAAQKMALGVCMKLRANLQENAADVEGTPLQPVYDAQLADADGQIIGLLEGVGLPKKAAKTALEVQVQQVTKRIEHIRVERGEAGRFAPVNGNGESRLEMLTTDDVENMDRHELKDALKDRNLSTQGGERALRERLVGYLQHAH